MQGANQLSQKACLIRHFEGGAVGVISEEIDLKALENRGFSNVLACCHSKSLADSTHQEKLTLITKPTGSWSDFFDILHNSNCAIVGKEEKYRKNFPKNYRYTVISLPDRSSEEELLEFAVKNIVS